MNRTMYSVDRPVVSLDQQDFRRGIEESEFLLHFQPRIDVLSGRLIGAEALVRWSHPSWGFLYPSSFIPIAEHTEVIIPLGEWVLRSACQQNKKWQKAGHPPLVIAVNFSAIQFSRIDVVSMITRVLIDTNLDAKWLEIEITETTLMDLDDDMKDILNELTLLGVRISIDDFGTGYSSLTYLKKFKVNTLKIDRSFIQDIPFSSKSIAISKAIISLAHSLGMQVVAEGVETAEQIEFLRTQECDEAQGYLFGQPVSSDQFCDLYMARS